MSDKAYQKRKEEYQAISRRADEFAKGPGEKKQEAIKLLVEGKALAEKNNDSDYVLFFEAETIGYETDDYNAAIKKLGQLESNDDSFLFRQLGTYYSIVDNQDAAVEYFDRALAIKPDDYDALINKGVTLSQKGDDDAAIEYYDRALAIKPDDYDALRQKGVSLSKKGDEDAAIEYFDRALAIKPDDYDALRQKGVALSKKGDEDAAIEYFDRALAIKPDDSHALRQKGVSLSKKGDEDAAIEYYDRALAIKSDDYDALRQKGVSLSKKADQDAAIEYYDRALAIKPDDSHALSNKGVSLSKKGDEDAAIEYYDRALAIKPDDYDALINKGVTLSKKGDDDAAIEYYDRALAIKPDDYDALRQKGVSLSKKGDEDAAIEYFDRALAIKPDDYDALRQKGVALSKKGDEDAAIEYFDRALAIKPDDSHALSNKGVSLSKKGDDDAAIEYYDRALAIKPDDYDALRQKGVALSKKGDDDAAIEYYDRALAIKPDDYDALRQKGVSLSKKGDEDAAIEYYDRALAIKPDDYDAMRNKGVALSKKGDDDAAIEYFDRALAIKPDDSRALRNKSVSIYCTSGGDNEEAYDLMVRALKIAPEEHKNDFIQLCSLLDKKWKEEWKKIFPDIEAEITDRTEMSELFGFIQHLRNEYSKEAGGFVEDQEAEEKKQKEFLLPESKLDDKYSLFMVLRRWNSYTPSIPSGDQEKSIGGGYYIRNNGKGIVVDPGYNFLQNFDNAGCRIHDIDAVVITHAHNDHTIELETILTLIHEYNDNLKELKDESSEYNDCKEKKISLYLNVGSFMKFSGLVDLFSKDIKKIFVMNYGDSFDLGSEVSLTAVPAYHHELVATKYSCGLIFEIKINDKTKRLVFSGDTGLLPIVHERGKPQASKDLISEIWKGYQIDEVRPDLLVVHIGSIKKQELEKKLVSDDDIQEVRYPNHLGIIGTARVITSIQPKLAVVSEFGEEMKAFRCKLIKGLKENVVDKYLANNENVPPDRKDVIIVPGDLAFVYDIENEKYLDCTEVNNDGKEWANINNIDFAEDYKEPDKQTGIYYFDSDNKAGYHVPDKERAMCATNFDNQRAKIKRKMYFKNR